MQKSKLDNHLGSEGFFRFPSTPHLKWLGDAPPPRDDKLLTEPERRLLLQNAVSVEEKVDGANLGFSLDLSGRLRAQNRGQYLAEPPTGQFSRISAWLSEHGPSLKSILQPYHIVFGEWCAARHSLRYDRLPDLFLVFDVYDRRAGKFWSSSRRDALAIASGLVTTPRIQTGHFSLAALEELVLTSNSQVASSQPIEGVVIRQDSVEWSERRAKLVHPEFNQAIEEHWRRRSLEWNLLLRK